MPQHRPPLAWRESIPLARKDSSASGVMLFAKESGPTSFSSLGVIKKALGTGKVGHTGTLDSFAEGLLVVLVGKMTRLVPYITATEKRYQAVVAFGSETDTLEPSGQIIATSPLPSRQQVESVLDRFRGTISQVPPLYSAIHVDGQRASDLARSGQQAQLPSREITVHSLALTDFDGQYGLLEVTCSKGTYIRSLARDIALAAGSRGHLVALRRTGVGPFRLEDAVFSQRLTAFTLASRGQGEVPAAKASQQELEEVAAGLVQFAPGMAAACGLESLVLASGHETEFFQGQPPRSSWFTPWEGVASVQPPPIEGQVRELPVFLETGELAGMVKKAGGRFHYCFVIPRQG